MRHFASRKRGTSPPAHCLDDFYAVAIAQDSTGVLALRHDFVIDLNRNPALRVVAGLEQSDHGEIVSDITRFAVEQDLRHRPSLTGTDRHRSRIDDP